MESEVSRLRAQLAQNEERHAIELNAARAELDTLAYTISHDLRSPLTVTSGFAAILSTHSGKDLDEKGRHYLDRITQSADHIGRMMDDILALSRMSRSEMHPVRIDLDFLVKKLVRELDASKGDRRVIWLVGPLPSVTADPPLLRQAISSLISNALKFTLSREVARIQIGAHAGYNEIIFFVRDNGTGANTKHRERMFGMDQRPNSPPEPMGGAIGFSYLHRIIQRHGGRTWTETGPDGGATFNFSLPDSGTAPDFRSERT